MEDNNQKIRVTSAWMRAKYDEMNQLLFNGQLGECQLAPFTTGKGSQGRTLGWFKITGRDIRIERKSRKMFQKPLASWGYNTYIDANNLATIYF